MDVWPFVGALFGGAIGAAIMVVVPTSRRQRRHEAITRGAMAHEQARQELGPAAADVVRWMDAITWAALGPDLGMFDPEGTPADLRPNMSLRRLREIRTTHPTKAVRDAAKSLFEEISTCYAEPDPNVDAQFPTAHDRDKLLELRDRAETLVELIQSPPPQ